jgi:hypothetical protein
MANESASLSAGMNEQEKIAFLHRRLARSEAARQ